MPSMRRGFTLVEVAIVLVIIGLVAAGGLSIVAPLLDSGRTSTTLKRMGLVQDALQIYVEQFGCLPCPADGTVASTDANAGRREDSGGVYGTDCTGNACITADTVVPWRSLGISEEEATDGWDNRFRYYVGTGTGGCAGGGLHAAGNMERCDTDVFPTGSITVEDNDGVLGDVTDAAYVLVSSGPDGSRALTARGGVLTPDVYGQAGGGEGQEENFNDDATYAYGDFISVDDDTHFDDILRYMTAPVMIMKCGPGVCNNPS